MSGDWRLIRVNPMSPDRGITGCLRKKEVALPGLFGSAVTWSTVQWLINQKFGSFC